MKNTIKTVTIAVVASFLAVFVYDKISHDEKAPVAVEQSDVQSRNYFASVSSTPMVTTDFTEAAEKSVPAVVHVKVRVETRPSSGNNVFDYFFGPGYSQPRVQEGSGSGVIISPDGYIVTNNHVIDKSNDIEVVLNDKRSYQAKLVGADPLTDIALLKIDDENLPTLPIGNSDNLKVGEWVLAVGNPFSLSTTVTAGIVSAKARGIGIINTGTRLGIESFIQTDAAVNPGNSGGAMVNTSGELVGINAAIASPTGAYAGYAFAIPTSIVSKVVSDLKEFGEVQRALIGVNIDNIDAKSAKARGLNTLEGVYVGGVHENGAAEEAGMEEGDVIIGVNGVAVKSVSELQEQISRYRPGDVVDVEYLRNNKARTSKMTLRNQRGDTDIIKHSDTNLFGASFKELDQNTKDRLNLSYGVQVYNLQPGKLMKHDVREGYIITKINNQKIYTVEDVMKAAEDSEGAMFLTGIYPNGRIAYYAINLED